MTAPFTLYLAAFVSAWAVAFFSLPLWRIWCARNGLMDDPGHRKIHTAPIPLAGGVTVLTALLLPLAIAIVLLKLGWLGEASTAPLLHGFAKRAGQLTGIVLGAFGMTVVGLLDDRLELPPAQKFIAQLGIAGMVAAAGVRITLFVPAPVFSYAITILWLLIVVNAFNFMDNMNGLCGGLGAIGAAWFGGLAAYHGQYLVALLAFLTLGALGGFLPHNFPRARAFLGDSGSHLVGFLLAIMAVLPHFHSEKHPQPLAVLVPLFVLAVPLGDLAWVVILRLRLGKPFYIGDTNHLSHRLVRAGLSNTAAVLLIWLLAVVIAGGSLFLLGPP
ncbi:MAG TPA: MraY family glycosyltransferase [Verrucomicrobiota bacterium]|nr:MraY family glycosyltransferase [Verrucomicrobiota bacterium]HNT16114.1 MraY family glycosyltransferase [Verrucomicrobiota bacterium]